MMRSRQSPQLTAHPIHPGRRSLVFGLALALFTSSAFAQSYNPYQPARPVSEGAPALAQAPGAGSVGSLPIPQGVPATVPDVNMEQPAPRPRTPEAAQPPSAQNNFRLRQNVSLAEVQGHSGDIFLQGTYVKYTIPLPVSRRYNILTAKLRLSVVNSVALVAERSNLAVFLNDFPVYQTVLDGDNPAMVAEIDLPAARFERGYTTNVITLVINQHYTKDACEAPYSPDVWTQIDQFGSSFSLEAEPVRVLSAANTGQLNLDGLYLFLEQAPWYPERMHVYFPGAGNAALNDEQLSYGALLAQAVALRQRDRLALEINYGNSFNNEADNVIIGKRSEISDLLDARELSLISGPYISIKQNSQNPTKFILVVSGNTAEDIRNALTGLGYALVKGGLPGQDFWQVEPKYFQLPAPEADPKSLQDGAFGNPLVLNKPMLQGGGVHYFSSLGMGESPYSATGINYGSVPLTFHLPSDFFTRPDEHISLVLKYTVGRGLGPGSVVNVLANGTPAGAIDLVLPQDTRESRADQSANVFDRGRTINIPASVLRPGHNRIDIQPRLFPRQYELCTHTQTENLTFGLSPRSEIILPEFERFTQLPDLQLFDHTGFPLTRGMGGSDLSVYVPEKSPEAVISSWLYFASMVQRSGTPLQRAHFSFSLQEARRQLLVIGSANSLGEDVMTNSPITADEVRSGRLPQQYAVAPIEKKEGWLDSFVGWLGYTRTDVIDKLTVPFGLISDMPSADLLTPAGSGMMVQYKSSFEPNASVVLITAQDSETLLTSVKRLVTDHSRKRLQGDLVLWDAGSRRLRVDSYRYGEPYTMGSFASRNLVFFDKPNMFTVILIVTILAFALVSFFILRRLSKAEHS